MIHLPIDDERFEALGFAVLTAAVDKDVIGKDLALQSCVLLTLGSADDVIARADALIKIMTDPEPERTDPKEREGVRRIALLIGVWRDMVKLRKEAGEQNPTGRRHEILKGMGAS